MNRKKPFVITIEVDVEDDMEAYNIVESVLLDPRIKSCYIDPDVDEEQIENIAHEIKRRTSIKRIK